MGSPLPPDPYIALGVAKDASAGAIKLAYRKLILKFHPDKVQDAAQKQIASDEFHKVQTAYEIVGDEEKRARYDAQCKLADLRRDMMDRQGGSTTGEARDAYRSPTESPRRSSYATHGYDPRGERIVEERRPYDAEYFDRPRTTSRKDSDYERTRRSSATPRTERERARASRQSAKENERTRQREKVKQATRNTRRAREYKYSADRESDSDESDYTSPVDKARHSRREDDEPRRARDAYYDAPRRSREDVAHAHYADDRYRKMTSDESTARDYIERSRTSSRQQQEAPRRPSPPRVSSKDKVEYIKRGDGRPAVMVRRGSGKPRQAEREPEQSPRRDRERTRRSSYDNGEPRKAPPLPHTKSAPDQIRMPPCVTYPGGWTMTAAYLAAPAACIDSWWYVTQTGAPTRPGCSALMLCDHDREGRPWTAMACGSAWCGCLQSAAPGLPCDRRLRFAARCHR